MSKSKLLNEWGRSYTFCHVWCIELQQNNSKTVYILDSDIKQDQVISRESITDKNQKIVPEIEGSFLICLLPTLVGLAAVNYFHYQLYSLQVRNGRQQTNKYAEGHY